MQKVDFWSFRNYNVTVQYFVFTAQSVRKRQECDSRSHHQRRFSWTCGVTIHGF